MFGPSSMIGFGELDQVFALAVGACAGVASIWDSVSDYQRGLQSDVLPLNNVEEMLVRGI